FETPRVARAARPGRTRDDRGRGISSTGRGKGEEGPNAEADHSEAGEGPAQAAGAEEGSEGGAAAIRPVDRLRQPDEGGGGVRGQGPGRGRRQTRRGPGTEAECVLPASGKRSVRPAGRTRRRGVITLQPVEKICPCWPECGPLPEENRMGLRMRVH